MEEQITPHTITPLMFRIIRALLPDGSTILELGSGDGSTQYLSQFYKVYSVESEENWVGKYNSTYIYCPLKEIKPTKHFAKSVVWYDPEKIKIEIPKIKYDFLLIDGPAGAENRGGLYKYRHTFNFDVPIIFDDTNRTPDNFLARAISSYSNKKCIFTFDLQSRKQFSLIFPNKELINKILEFI